MWAARKEGHVVANGSTCVHASARDRAVTAIGDGALLVHVLGVSCTLTVRRAVLWGVHAQLLAAAAAAAA